MIKSLLNWFTKNFLKLPTKLGFRNFVERIQSSLRNLELTTEACLQDDQLLTYSFLESEQMLPAGHNLHPFTKSRMGFSEEEQLLYGPEFRKGFQLDYFLIHKDCITEKSLPGISAKEIFENGLLAMESYDFEKHQ